MDDPRPAVLVVDDETMNRSLFRATLGASCEVIEAASGAQALELLQKRRVDLVLLDVMMPEMNGYDVCKRIKELSTEYLPVLLVTALGEQEDRNRGLEAGADDFLSKPVDRRELLLRTRAFLRLREQEKVIRSQLEQLQRLQHAKDDLVALLVHDLRSPLAGIIAHLQLLQEELSGQQAHDVQQALRAADTALGRLEETLQVRLLEEGRLQIRRSPVQLGTVVREAVSTLESVAKRKKVSVSRAVTGAAVAAVDETLLQRSIENLLTNALKYTPSGGDVAVAVHGGEEALEIEVSDRGPGVPDDLKTTLSPDHPITRDHQITRFLVVLEAFSITVGIALAIRCLPGVLAAEIPDDH